MVLTDVDGRQFDPYLDASQVRIECDVAGHRRMFGLVDFFVFQPR